MKIEKLYKRFKGRHATWDGRGGIITGYTTLRGGWLIITVTEGRGWSGNGPLEEGEFTDNTDENTHWYVGENHITGHTVLKFGKDKKIKTF